MDNLSKQKQDKIDALQEQKKAYKAAKHYYRDHRNDDKAKKRYEIEKRKMERISDALIKLKVSSVL